VGVRRFLLLLLAAVAVASYLGSAAMSTGLRPGSAARLSSLKLLQFNVREGATGGRAAGVVAVIEASGADVVTLEEVTVKSIFEQIAADVGFHSYYVPGVAGYSVGILSRFPIRSCFGYNQAPLQRAAYGCRIPIAGTNWWVFGAQLGSGSHEVARSKEAAFLLAQMNQHPTEPIVLAGDLNSQTPGENDQTPLIVIPMLKQSGYIDSFRELRPSVQKNPGLTITAPPYGTWERRLDYVFHNQKARATAARVISSVKGFTWPSDHAALAVTLINRPPKPIPTG
jgi:endonuclease/exonuclease/phosphatase family metal-dependent hydrolase